jgi:hypothetical protein
MKPLPSATPTIKGAIFLTSFDPIHNVFVIIEGTTVWAYRYQSG